MALSLSGGQELWPLSSPSPPLEREKTEPTLPPEYFIFTLFSSVGFAAQKCQRYLAQRCQNYIPITEKGIYEVKMSCWKDLMVTEQVFLIWGKNQRENKLRKRFDLRNFDLSSVLLIKALLGVCSDFSWNSWSLKSRRAPLLNGKIFEIFGKILGATSSGGGLTRAAWWGIVAPELLWHFCNSKIRVKCRDQLWPRGW